MCQYCTNYRMEYDGEYGERKYPICTIDMPYQCLKGFPFKRPPKPCKEKKLFEIDPIYLTRYWEITGMFCEGICGEQCGSCGTACDVYDRVEGMTDLYRVDVESDLKYHQYNWDKVCERLGKMKLYYRDVTGKKHLWVKKEAASCENTSQS